MVASSSTVGRYFTDTLQIVYRGIGDLFSHGLSCSEHYLTEHDQFASKLTWNPLQFDSMVEYDSMILVE